MKPANRIQMASVMVISVGILMSKTKGVKWYSQNVFLSILPLTDNHSITWLNLCDRDLYLLIIDINILLVTENSLKPA